MKNLDPFVEKLGLEGFNGIPLLDMVASKV
jgi:hypothetical protein